MATRYRFGQQAACSLCDQDIEYHGKGKWLDRGADTKCGVYLDRIKGEYVRPPVGTKHKPTAD